MNCSVLQCVAVCCSVVQCVAVCVAACCSVSDVLMCSTPIMPPFLSSTVCITISCSASQWIAVCCNVRCSVLQRVAACCSVSDMVMFSPSTMPLFIYVYIHAQICVHVYTCYMFT